MAFDDESIFQSGKDYTSCMSVVNTPAYFLSTREIFKAHVHLRLCFDGTIYFMLMIGTNIALSHC